MARLAGRPPVASVVREGDPAGAVVMVLWTGGLGPGAAPAAAIAGALEARLAHALPGAEVILQAEAVRVRRLVQTAEEARRATAAMAAALREPIGDGTPAMAAARRKLGALARLRLPDRSFAPLALCTQAPWAEGDPEGASASDIEGWRAGAAGLARVAFATTGSAALHDGSLGALADGPAWPNVGAPQAASLAPVTAVATGTRPQARVQVVLPVAPERAPAVAARLAEGPLAVRLQALGAGARFDAVSSVLRPGVGCAAVDLVLDGDVDDGRIAEVAALALGELEGAAAEGGDVVAPTDPREAAEQAALRVLVEATPASPAAGAAFVTLPAPRGAAPGKDAPEGRRARIVAELERARAATRTPVVEARTRVERGQGELWLLLGSPCGTQGEGEEDAGAAALFASAAARAAGLEAWISADGVGLIAHGARRPGEDDAALARRVADKVARAWATDPLDALAPARRALLDAAPDGALVALAAGLAPGHPSWVLPSGTPEGLTRLSAAAVATRAAALRAGPLRVAILANADAAQAAVAHRAVDRWIVRRGGETRSCGPAPGTSPVPGVHRGTPGTGTVALAFPVPAEARDVAWALAAVLGEAGVLGAKLSARGAVRSVSAHVAGPARAPAVVVALRAPDAALDAAVGQARAVFDELRRGEVTDAELARAVADGARADDRRLTDPRQRLVRLFRGAPVGAPAIAPAELRRALSITLRDEALVVGAARSEAR